MEGLGYTNVIEGLLIATRTCMEIWQRLVHITCDGFELDKSNYATMSWQLKEGKEKKSTFSETPGSVSLRSEKYKGLEVELTCNEVTTAERQLGVCLAMSG